MLVVSHLALFLTSFTKLKKKSDFFISYFLAEGAPALVTGSISLRVGGLFMRQPFVPLR